MDFAQHKTQGTNWRLWSWSNL